MPSIDLIAKPPALRAAQGLAVFATAAGAGASAALTVFVIPRILESSTAALLARQWQRTYDAGKVTIIGMAATAAAAFVYADWLGQRASSQFVVASRLPLVAAGLGLAIVPYTMGTMLPVNRALMARAAGEAGSGEDSDEETRTLVQRWGSLNLGRTVFLTLASVTGLVAFL